MAQGIQRIEYDGDPNRCQGIARQGSQCNLVRMDNSNYCRMHGGMIDLYKEQKENLQVYQVTKYRKRLDQMQRATGARSLDDELALIRILLEDTLIKASEDDVQGLVLYSGKIRELVALIKDLVISLNRLNTQNGLMINRAEAITLASRLTETISMYIDDEQTLLLLANDVIKLFTEKQLDAPNS